MAVTTTLPDINRYGSQWTPDDVAQYYTLPTTALEYKIQHRKWTDGFLKISDTIKWDQAAENMTLVIDERPPSLYQEAYPTAMCALPTTNVVSSGQRTTTLSLFRKRFESPQFSWHADFKIFIKNRVAKGLQQLLDEAKNFRSVFYRTYMFHNSPVLGIMGQSPSFDEGTPTGIGNTAGTSGKTNAYLADTISNMGGKVGVFTLSALQRMYGDIIDMNVTPMQEGTQKENMCINDTFTLMIEDAEYRALAHDPMVVGQTNASIADFNLVNDTFKGRLLGCFNVMPFHRGQRFYVNTDGTIERPAPEEIHLDGAFKYRPETTTKYRNAQIGVGYIVGHKAYTVVDPGSPPKGWQAKDANGKGLAWNGRPVLTDYFNIDEVQADTSVKVVPNTYGEFLKWIDEEKMGIGAAQPHNLIPFLYLRRKAVGCGMHGW